MVECLVLTSPKPEVRSRKSKADRARSVTSTSSATAVFNEVSLDFSGRRKYLYPEFECNKNFYEPCSFVLKYGSAVYLCGLKICDEEYFTDCPGDGDNVVREGQHDCAQS